MHIRWSPDADVNATQDMAEVAPPEAPAPQMKKAREPHPGAMAGDAPQVEQHIPFG